MKLNVLIADDHRIFRQGLKSLLEKEPDLRVAAEAQNGREVVELADQASPDLVIMDVAMPGLNGIEATRKLLALKPGIRVIGLSMHTDRRFVSEMLKAGAVGFVSKDSAFEELVQAIRTVLAGKVYLSPAAAGVVVDDYLRRSSVGEANAFSSLTAREREVLQLMAEGRNTKQIAMDLHVSIKTVETHRRQIMEKLELFSVAEL
ncbi:MAG TPA: response regulator transcription factor, partial [Tepidisphaeraceae bacterium]|nr:response regulator transcription factor [Tepidisphaeraceae bacterium]